MDKKNPSKITAIANFFKWLVSDIADIGVTFAQGDWKTRISFLIMGFGQFMRKQFLRGAAFLAIELAFIYYMVSFGANYLKDITTLGTKETGFDENYVLIQGDNSFLILLYSVLSIILIGLFIFVWRLNIRQNKQAQNMLAKGMKLPTVKQDFMSLLDENFDKTLLALPMLGVFVFTILPIVFMICIAFTNYDYNILKKR